MLVAATSVPQALCTTIKVAISCMRKVLCKAAHLTLFVSS
jgi:hypothetical protein